MTMTQTASSPIGNATPAHFAVGLRSGIQLDLSEMTGIEVHPEDRTVTGQAGCTLGVVS